MKNNQKFVLVFVLFSFFIVFLSSCARNNEPAPDLVLWTGFGDRELTAVQEIARKFNAEKNLNVQVVRVPFEELKVKYQISAPAGQGPDLMTGPQDWIGAMATANLISPISESELSVEERKKYNPIGIQGMTYDGRLYGLPLSLETVALIYNTDLVGEPPNTMAQVLTSAQSFTRAGEGKYGFFYEIKSFYFSWAFFSGFGAKIFGEKDGRLDVDNVLLDSPESLKALKYLSDMYSSYKLIPNGATTDMMNAIFFNRNMMFCLNGPWMMGDLRKKEINFDVMALPVLENGQNPRPFVGVQGVFLNTQSKNRALAIEFMDYMNLPENQVELCASAGRIPSREETLKLVSDEKTIKFAEVAKMGCPLPNHPAMGQVWEPMNQALQLIVIDGHDPQAVLTEQVKRIKQNIKIMME